MQLSTTPSCPCAKRRQGGLTGLGRDVSGRLLPDCLWVHTYTMKVSLFQQIRTMHDLAVRVVRSALGRAVRAPLYHSSLLNMVDRHETRLLQDRLIQALQRRAHADAECCTRSRLCSHDSRPGSHDSRPGSHDSGPGSHDSRPGSHARRFRRAQ